jgi:hypothetical protein
MKYLFTLRLLLTALSSIAQTPSGTTTSSLPSGSESNSTFTGPSTHDHSGMMSSDSYEEQREEEVPSNQSGTMRTGSGTMETNKKPSADMNDSRNPTGPVTTP